MYRWASRFPTIERMLMKSFSTHIFRMRGLGEGKKTEIGFDLSLVTSAPSKGWAWYYEAADIALSRKIPYVIPDEKACGIEGAACTQMISDEESHIVYTVRIGADRSKSMLQLTKQSHTPTRIYIYIQPVHKWSSRIKKTSRAVDVSSTALSRNLGLFLLLLFDTNK